MNFADIMVFALLALADLALLIHLRRSRARRLRARRLNRCLEVAIQRENAASLLDPSPRRWPLRRAS